MCSPDSTFSDKTIGPSGVNWKEHFTSLKQTLLSSPQYCAELLSWYDAQIFTKTRGLSSTPTAPALGEVDELIQRLFQAGVTPLSSTLAPSSSAALAPVQVVELLMQTPAVVQAEEPVEGNSVESEQPRRGQPKSTRSSKKGTGK